MSIRRVLTLGGTALVAVLWTTPAGALPTPPTVPDVPLPAPPVVGVAPVDAAVAIVSNPAAVAPALSSLQVPRVPHVTDRPGTVVHAVPLPAIASRPDPAVEPRRSGTSARSMAPGAAPHARGEGAATGGRPSRAEHERATVAPAVNSTVVDALPVGVRGALDTSSDAKPWSILGTAVTSLALWGALCALALVARWIAMSAWRDASRRRRTLSLR
jgi:hypothetical protein